MKVVQDVVAKILATIGYVHYYYRGTGEGGSQDTLPTSNMRLNLDLMVVIAGWHAHLAYSHLCRD